MTKTNRENTYKLNRYYDSVEYPLPEWQLKLLDELARAALSPQPRPRKQKGTDATQSKDSEEK